MRPAGRTHSPTGEEARVNAVFGAIEQKLGFVPDGLRLSPSLMAMIRYLVSWNSKCQFCIDMNEGFLANMGVDIERVRAARAQGWSERDVFGAVAQAASNRAFSQVLRTFKVEHQGVYS